MMRAIILSALFLAACEEERLDPVAEETQEQTQAEGQTVTVDQTSPALTEDGETVTEEVVEGATEGSDVEETHGDGETTEG